MEQLLSRPEIQSAVIPFRDRTGGLSRPAQSNRHGMAMGAARRVPGIGRADQRPHADTPHRHPQNHTAGHRLIFHGRTVALGSASHNLQRRFTTIVCQVALLWVFWAVLGRMDSASMVLFLAGTISLVLVLEWSFVRVVEQPAQLHGAGFSLLLGVGLSATAAASALLGQLALALAAASGGAFLGWVLIGNARAQTASSLSPPCPM